MKRKRKKALVKMYTWADLTQLAVRDLCERNGRPFDPEANLHYMGGLDAKGNPFIRIDLTPLPGVKRLKP